MVNVCVLEIDSAGFPKVMNDNNAHFSNKKKIGVRRETEQEKMRLPSKRTTNQAFCLQFVRH